MAASAATTAADGAASQRRRAPLPFQHRPALDGIRAVAVLLVLFFHAGTPLFRHGYVGVDVFFVLSGFLITSLLARELVGTGRLRFVGFYARRVRRLLPAALAVLLVTAVAYELVAPPSAVAENRGGFVASALYVANWFFLSQSHDYFASDAHPSPVQHYWSLSVEEQFYLLWPVLLLCLALLARRYRFRIDVATAALAAAGLVYAGVLALTDPMGSYLGTPARVYQLLLGASVAFVCLRRERRARPERPGSSVWGAAAAVVGLAAIVASGTTLLGTGSPYWHGVAAAFASAAVILGLETRPASGVARLLAWRPARVLGLWSYAAYLWHWPVVVLGDEVGFLPAAWLPRTIAVLVLTLPLAWGTYVLLERPARRISLRTFPRQRLVAVLGLAGAAAIAFLFPPILRIDGDAAAILAQKTASAKSVVAVAGGGKSTVLLVGDSHAQTLYPALKSLAEAQGWTLVPATKIACPWPRVAATDDNGVPLDCEPVRSTALRDAERRHPGIAILVSRSIVARPISAAGRLLTPGTPDWLTEVRLGTLDFLSQLQPLVGKIVIVEPFPETSTSMVDCLSTGASPPSCDQPLVHLPGTAQMTSYWRSLPDVTTVSLDELICPRGSCPAVVDGVQTHADTNHLTIAYSRHLAQRLDEYLRARGIFLARGEVRRVPAAGGTDVLASEPTP
ncbi:MAG TPA: acyltransferase family protein [Gaiellaceae bacterium]